MPDELKRESSPFPLSVVSICVGIGVVVLLAAAFFFLRSSSSSQGACVEGVEASFNQARLWLKTGDEKKSATEKAISYTRGLAYLNSIRLTMLDDDIENLLREDVTQLVTELEEKQMASIKALDADAEAFAATSLVR